MKRILVPVLLLMMFLAACGQISGESEAVYMNITAAEAKKLMDSETGYIILDVRTEEEYARDISPGPSLFLIMRSRPGRRKSCPTRIRCFWSTAAAAGAARLPPRL